MIIYGASGHAKVIIDIINSEGRETIDFIFDDDDSIKTLLGYKVEHQRVDDMQDYKVVVAIGNNAIRRKVVKGIQNPFCDALVHGAAILDESAVLGQGSVVMPNATINSSAQIGYHCIINTGAIVEHDVVISDFVHVSPGSVITGNVQIGKGTHIGANATIIPGVKIGKWATIGAGAVIIEDIPDFAVVVGNPGKIIKFNRTENEKR